MILESPNNKGFTLVEVLISTVMLVLISFSVYQLMTNTFKLRTTLTTEGDFYTEVRLSMGILGQDISMIFSPKNLVPAPSSTPSNGSQPPGGTQPPAPGNPNPDDGVTSAYWGKLLDPASGIRNTRFLGKETFVSFIATSNLRIYRESKESEYAKVSYFLEKYDGEDDAYKNTQVLYKTVDTDVFDLERDDSKRYRKTVLLRGIESWKWTFFDKSKDRWQAEWDNAKADYLNRLPDLFKVEVSIKGPQNLHFDGTYLFRSEAPIEGLYGSF